MLVVIAEAQTTLQAVEYSCYLELQSIILERNSLQVVNAVKTNDSNLCRYRHTIGGKYTSGSF
jgi:hypothetical protein